MANIVITTTTNIFIVDFGVYSSMVGFKKATFQKKGVSFQLMVGSTFIRVQDARGDAWTVSFNASGDALVIDSINGIVPTDNDHLFTLLSNEIA